MVSTSVWKYDETHAYELPHRRKAPNDNGVPIIQDGSHTGAKPGRFIKSHDLAGI